MRHIRTTERIAARRLPRCRIQMDQAHRKCQRKMRSAQGHRLRRRILHLSIAGSLLLCGPIVFRCLAGENPDAPSVHKWSLCCNPMHFGLRLEQTRHAQIQRSARFLHPAPGSGLLDPSTAENRQITRRRRTKSLRRRLVPKRRDATVDAALGDQNCGRGDTTQSGCLSQERIRHLEQ